MTTRARFALRPMLATAAFVVAAASLTGCLNPFNPLIAKNRVGATDPPPYPSRPDQVVRLFEWCWDHRSIAEYEEIFTEDFQFEFAATDTAGNAFRDRALTRFDEIETARHLFVGGGTSPPANSITLQLDQNLISQPDSRPGKQDTTYFQEIITSVVLRIKTDEEEFQVTGAARFFMVRGDSALIPAELVARGFHSDPGRWYIQRWEDETVGTAGANSAVRDRGWAGLAARRPGADAGREARGTAVESWPYEVSWGFVKRVFYAAGR
jgi:hypothetical protein